MPIVENITCKDATFGISRRQGYVVRGIAMLMILFVHSLNEYPAFSSIFSRVVLIPFWGELGSGLFFFMSGYGLYQSMAGKTILSPQYLYIHFRKFLLPFIVCFLTVIPAALISSLYGHHIYLHLGSILCLSLPDGTDVWFLKTIILLYIILYMVVKYIKNESRRVLMLFLLLSIYTVILYSSGVAGYWYDSNLCFVMGVYYSVNRFRINKCHVTIAGILFIAFYVFTLYGYRMAPTQIVGNIVSCIILLKCVLYFKIEKREYNTLVYIGQNSLLYYLFNIPIMIALPASQMHWTLYFILNFGVTSFFVYIYRSIIKTR